MTTDDRQIDGSCCDGTGFADYAAVPCPNPDCPVTRPGMRESNFAPDRCPRCGGAWTMNGDPTFLMGCTDAWHKDRFPLGTAKVRD